MALEVIGAFGGVIAAPVAVGGIAARIPLLATRVGALGGVSGVLSKASSAQGLLGSFAEEATTGQDEEEPGFGEGDFSAQLFDADEGF